jgi:hypothetical protein
VTIHEQPIAQVCDIVKRTFELVPPNRVVRFTDATGEQFDVTFTSDGNLEIRHLPNSRMAQFRMVVVPVVSNTVEIRTVPL